MCEKVSRLCGIHRKVVDLVVSGLVDMMAEDIDDGKTIQMGEFGLFRPTIKPKVRIRKMPLRQAISFQNVSCLHRERYSTAC